MASELQRWAVSERRFIKDDIKSLKAGARLISPSGDDITARKLAELELRLEHLNTALAESPSE